MKRSFSSFSSFSSFIFSCALSLVIGLLAGILLPIDLLRDDTSVPASTTAGKLTPLPVVSHQEDGGSSTASVPDPLDPEDNFPLLRSAYAVCLCLQQQDWGALAAYVHPDRGVTFTPYSTVDPDSDLNFTADQIRNLAQDQNVYTWGFKDGRGDAIQMTFPQYLERYVCDRDYTQVPEIGVDRVMTGGNALENLTEVYGGCRYVDFSFPSVDPVNDGLDWSSLKLVFQPEAERWYLVGIVHGEWTI